MSVNSADIYLQLCVREHFQLKVITNARQIVQLPSKEESDRLCDQAKCWAVVL